MRIIKYFFTIIMILCMLCSCTKGRNELNIKISPDDKNVNELTTKTYTDYQLLSISQFDDSIETLIELYPAECVRKSNDMFRFSYLGKDKITVITFDNYGNKVMGNVYSLNLHKSDFTNLSEGQLLEEVQNIDPKGNYIFLYTGRSDVPKISNHYTYDGYLVNITYDDNNIVTNIDTELI